MTKQEYKKQLQERGLYSPSAAQKLDEAFAKKDKQKAEKLENHPHIAEQVELQTRGVTLKYGKPELLELKKDIEGYEKHNGKNEFMENLTDSKDSSVDDKRRFVQDRWQEVLDEKIQKWSVEQEAEIESDFEKRMAQWMNQLEEAKKLQDDLGECGDLFGDLTEEAINDLDLENLGDKKYKWGSGEGEETDEIPENIRSFARSINGGIGGSKFGGGAGSETNKLRRHGIEQVRRYYAMIKDNKALKDLCDLLGHLEKEETMMLKEMIKEKQSYTYTQIIPTKRYKEEISGVTLGRDLENLLPQEFALLDDPDLEILFDLKYVENRLFCFEKQGYISLQKEAQEEVEKEQEKEEKKKDEKGHIIICVDTSGSMSGAPETTAKAITLLLAAKAKREKRECYLINFSIGTSEMELTGKAGIKKLARFLEMSFGGGTDVEPALEAGIKKMDSEAYKSADLLVISDGGFGSISQQLLEKMDKQREKENRFYLLDVNGNSGTKHFFDKHWLYDTRSKNVRQLAELKRSVGRKL